MAKAVTIGLIVNPIAGMGGSVGLKGTDGPEILNQAISRGARPLAAERALRALKVLSSSNPDLKLLAAPGRMGADLLEGIKIDHQSLAVPMGDTTDRSDTQLAAKAMKDAGVELILFAGGDGTARDLLEAVGQDIPVVGIPCGVKMYSGVFTTSPEAAGHLTLEFVDQVRRGNLDQVLRRAEVMDIDENDYRAGQLSATLFGYALCPHIASRLQGPKARSSIGEDTALMSAATEIVSKMESGRVYLIGPGHSAKTASDVLGITNSLLGVDAVVDRALTGRDLDANAIDRLVGDAPVSLILGVIGGQGYILGRGNQQISADIIRKAGRDGLIVISSEDKLIHLNSERLLVDTGDAQLDAELEGYIQVHTGAGRRMMMRLSAGH